MPCTLTAVARAAKVGVSTVSYALRGDPKIPPATAQRIREVAQRLGYRANPAIAGLMAHIRAGRMPRDRENLAFVWIEANKAESQRGFNGETIRGARARASQLGYEIQEFWLGATDLSARRLGEILAARGIRGVVFSGCERETAVRLEMDWSAHAMAIVGNAPWMPELHRAGHNHYMATKRAMLELQARGYAMPAAILDAAVNQRTSRGCEAAFLAYHPSPQRGRSLLRFEEVLENGPRFRRWIAEAKADVIVIAHPATYECVRALDPGAARRCGFVSLDLVGNPHRISGIVVDHEVVAANAVDMVIGQLYRHETGVPKDPHRLLVEGSWFEGQTLRARGAPERKKVGERLHRRAP